MLFVINGALAAFNGVLAASYRVWCECVLGGTCCEGVCQCDPGVCCSDVWHPDSDPDAPCEEGEVFRVVGCSCGCFPEEQETPSTQRCCDETGNCTEVPPEECDGESLAGCCELGCPASCCTEDATGVVSCDVVDSGLCTGFVDPEPCESACKGACCIDGELTENSPTTQAECDEVDGCWWGVGSMECGTEGFCRAPFDDDCCESVVSSAELLTFTGPRKRRCPEIPGCSAEVTVEVTTGSPVYIHGGLFGAPYEACTDETTFVVCNDQFHVTPAKPCSGNLQNVDIKVCWDEGTGGELLRFRCCQDITHLIGNCDCDCETTVLYEEEGCTSNAAFVMRGNATIDASGTGPLVLTADILQGSTCNRTLTLAGISPHDNEISGEIRNPISGTLSVDKTGPGLWRLSGASNFDGRLRVLDGTAVVATVVGDGPSPFGGNDNLLAQAGSDAAGLTGRALLLSDGFTVGRGIEVPALGAGSTQEVVIGGVGLGTATFLNGHQIQLGRDVTLQASTGGTAVFINSWREVGGGSNPSVAFTVGSAGNAGTVVFASNLPASITGVLVVEGILRLQGSERIGSATPVTLGVGVTFDLDGGEQTLERIEMFSSTVSNGTLETLDQFISTGSSTISADVVLGAATEFDVTGSLLISGEVGGAGSVEKSGSGTLTLSGTISYTGATLISDGTLIVEQIHDGSPDVAQATFTDTTLAVAFTTTPVSAATYKLLGGATTNSYTGQVTLTGAGGATGTYDSATSTLTID